MITRLGCVGISGLMAVLLLLVDGAQPITPALGGNAGARLFVYATATGFILTGIALSVIGIISAQKPPRVFCLGGILAALSLLASCAVGNYLDNSPLLLITGCIFGVSLTILLVYWGFCLSLLEESKILYVLAISCLVAAAIKLILFVLAPPLTAAVMCLLSICLFVSSLSGMGIGSTGKGAEQNREPTKDQAVVSTVSIKSAFKSSAIPFIALLLVIYIVAALWSARLSGEVIATDPMTTGAWGIISGFIITGIALLVVAVCSFSGVLRKIFLTAPVICIGILVLTRFLGNWQEEHLLLLTNIPLGVMISALTSLICLCLILEIKDGASSLMLFGAGLATTMGFFCIVFALWPILRDPAADNISLTLLVAYLIFVAVYYALYSVLPSRANRVQEPFGTPEQSSRMLVPDTAVFEQFSLTKREREVLDLMVQGWSNQYMAETLFVSTNTIKTHVKRIYQKCDLHSREEFLELLYHT